MNRHSKSTDITTMWIIAICGIISGVFFNAIGLPLEGGGIAIMSLGPLMLFLDRRLFPGIMFGALTLNYLYHALGYVIGPLFQMYFTGYLTNLDQNGLVAAQWGGVLGLVTLAIAFPRIFMAFYKWFAAGNTPKNHYQPELSWQGYGTSTLIVGSLAVIYGFLTGASNRLGGQESVTILTSTLSSAFASVFWVALFFLGYSATKKRGVFYLWLIIITAYSSLSLLDGTRGPVVRALIISALGFVWGGYSARKIIIYGLIATIFYMPVCGVVLKYRTLFPKMRTATSFDERLTGLKTAWKRFKSEQYQSFTHSIEPFMQNVTAQSVDRVFVLTPSQIPFAGWEGLDKAIYSFVPKLIWPERPERLGDEGNELAILYEAATPDSKGSYMPAVGDGYRRFGWPGVVLLYLFSASIYAFWMAFCWAQRERPERMAMLIFLILNSPGIWSATLLTNFYLLLWTIPKYWVLLWLIARVHIQFKKFFFSRRDPASPYERRRPLALN